MQKCKGFSSNRPQLPTDLEAQISDRAFAWWKKPLDFLGQRVYFPELMQGTLLSLRSFLFLSLHISLAKKACWPAPGLAAHWPCRADSSELVHACVHGAGVNLIRSEGLWSGCNCLLLRHVLRQVRQEVENGCKGSYIAEAAMLRGERWECK
eukprot:1153539-Pelagomonas_calceolata.AAC.1